MKNSLLKDAIADAKDLKLSAIESAKATLTEAFQPAISRIISSKIAEEDYIDDENEMPSDEMGGEMDDLELDEYLRELEGEEEEVDDIPIQAPAPAPSAEAPPAPPAEPTPEMPPAPPAPEEEDPELAEIIKELEESLDGEFGDEELDEGEGLDETPPKNHPNTLGEGDGMDETPPKNDPNTVSENEDADDMETVKEELAEAKKAINHYKSVLNEVKLLNAKLMYAMSLNNKFSLDEQQQDLVLRGFDRATTIRETKLVYASLSEALKNSSKKKVLQSKQRRSAKNITESRNRSVKPQTEQYSFVPRWKQLANLK